jgi:carbon monoxide dehydrogenase subunit G
MIIQSSSVHVAASLSSVKEFLCDARNISFLLPQDKISEFQASEDQCSFKAQGGILINLLFDEQNEQFVRYKSGEGSPFSFTLTISLNSENENCHGNVTFDGQVNGFMKVLIEKPLKSLFEQMSIQLKAHFEQN